MPNAVVDEALATRVRCLRHRREPRRPAEDAVTVPMISVDLTSYERGVELLLSSCPALLLERLLERADMERIWSRYWSRAVRNVPEQLPMVPA
jgi:hypothetical protein